MTQRIVLRHLSTLACFVLAGSPLPAVGDSAARDCLDHAASAAASVSLPGDQSAVRRRIAETLAETDGSAVQDLAAGIRSAADAARALGAAAHATAATDPESAREMADAAGRLLLRLANPHRRDLEQRLLLWELAETGEIALAAAPELPADDARDIVVRGCAARDARKALRLFDMWQAEGALGDRARAAMAERLAGLDPARALELAHGINSPARRDEVFGMIAGRQEPWESVAIAAMVRDPLARSAIVLGAAVRLAPEDPEVAAALAESVVVAPESALAEVAVALLGVDEKRALTLARSLPAGARRWTLGAIAVALAATQPERAEQMLAELGDPAEAVRLAAARVAPRVWEGAVRLARSLPEGEARDAALAAVAAKGAETDWQHARDLCWEIATPKWRTHAVGAVVLRLAHADLDAATSLSGLVAEEEDAHRLRAEIAVVVAARDRAAAEGILSSAPPSQYRTEAGFSAARAALSAGASITDALTLAEVGASRDTALRWLAPALARTQTDSPVRAAEIIGDPLLRALALVDAARVSLRSQARAHASPERARQVRLIVGWEEAP